MSDTKSRGAVDSATDTPDTDTPDTDTPDTEASDRGRKVPPTVVNNIGLFIAPILIAVLGLFLYLYYQSLDLANAPIQQRSALEFMPKLVPQIQRHLYIAFLSTLLVVVVAIPAGIILTRPALKRVAPYIISVATSGQALPAYGLLIIFLTFFGQGPRTVILALALYALLPVLRNTMVGLEAVDQSVIEAGRGMGMTKMRVLKQIELPLAVPVIVAGIRTAVILNIGMATLAFLIGGGGLGITINSGLKLNQDPVLIVGSVLVALIALTFDWIGAVAEKVLKPRGIA